MQSIPVKINSGLSVTLFSQLLQYLIAIDLHETTIMSFSQVHGALANCDLVAITWRYMLSEAMQTKCN